MTVKRLMILIAMMSVACGDDSGGDSDEGTTQSDASMPIASDSSVCNGLTYDTFGKSFITKYCNECHAGSLVGAAARHAAPDDDVYDTLAQVKTHALDMQSQVSTGAMPFQSAGITVALPTDAERAQFVTWINCGPN